MSEQPQDIETPIEFYLGNEYDLTTRTTRLDRPAVMYDHRHLLTHGVIVGMTGSGKTALSICLLEEAAIDNIPTIIFDVKGDLTNLLLQFPELKPSDFQHWMNSDDARRRKQSPEEHASELADRWRQGLEGTRQSAERIQRLKDSGEWLIYTPGSDAGLPLSVLKTFAAPKGKIAREDLNQKIDATTSALLGLTGIVSDPIQSREHILIAQLLKVAWEANEDLDLKTLIRRIQNPHEYIETIGAFPVDEFFPEKERLKLALALNNILASPSFSTWVEGEPLDFQEMLYGGEKARQVIFYLAHLEDTQRMFFLTLLLDEILTWTRKQSGTTSLRALVYFDEVYGYIPPHPANPPTKLPLMMLLKQARAFGVGIVLATQNPVDLDYKALSNAGTWMIGKLQTERDKARLLDGLEGVAAERGTLSDRAYLESVISALGNRVFLVNNVHQGKPFLMQTRWALSFLRGPMTRDQVAELMAPLKEARKSKITKTKLRPDENAIQARMADDEFKESIKHGEAVASTSGPEPIQNNAPEMPRDVAIYYFPINKPRAITPSILPEPGMPDIRLEPATPTPTSAIQPHNERKRSLIYVPRLFGNAEVIFLDKKRALELRRTYRFAVEPPAPGFPVAWSANTQLPEPVATAEGDSAVRYESIPEIWNSAKKLSPFKKELAEHLYRDAKYSLYENEDVELLSQPGEDLLAFLQRCKHAAQKAGEAELANERDAYTKKDRDIRSKVPPEVLNPPVIVDKTFSLSSIPLIGRLFGSSPPTPKQIIPKGMEKKVAEVKEKLADLQAKFERTMIEIRRKWEKIGDSYEEILLKPRKADVNITHFGLVWVPLWEIEYSDGTRQRIMATV